MKIDKNIPIPLPYHRKYPWEAMEVGDSIFVPTRKAGGSAKQSAGTYAKRHPPLKFQAAYEGDGMRIWRIN